MKNQAKILALENELRSLFSQLEAVQKQIKVILEKYSDGKNLKGDELVGWLGEIYGKTLLNGTLVHDREEHDFITPDNWRVSVKTRRGNNSGCKQTSAIPKFEGDDCPTHLMFVHLNEDYSLDRIWLFEWDYLVRNDRFKEHIVRGSHRSFYFTLDEKKDAQFIVFPKEQVESQPKDDKKKKPRKDANQMYIRSRARGWLSKYFPSEVHNDMRASKYHSPQKVWFFTFPVSFFDSTHGQDHTNILCENPDNENEFYYLQVPYKFFRQNQQRFSIRKTGDKFDLHISSDRNKWMVDIRGDNIDFKDCSEKTHF